MSLLEDIFLQDEADEAQELERVIEGDEYDDRPRSRSVSSDGDENINRDDEAEEDKRRVDPTSTKTKRVTKNPRFILNPARLTGPRGIQIIPDHFKDFKFKGKGHEKEDLDMVLKKLEHWAYRLYPKFQFEDCLKKIETLGRKRPVMVHLQKIRTDQFISEETVTQKDSSDDETPAPQEEDEFDKLLQQQIDLARSTPAPGSVKKVTDTPRQDRSPFTLPKATSSPSISDEQKDRMLRNRKLAEERRLARLKLNSTKASEIQESNNISDIKEVSVDESNVGTKKHNRSNVIDSSDEECDVTAVNEAVTVDIHNTNTIEKETVDKITETLKDQGEVVDVDIEMDRNIAIESDVIVINDNTSKVINSNKIIDITGQTKGCVDEIVDKSNEQKNRISTNNCEEDKTDPVVVVDEENKTQTFDLVSSNDDNNVNQIKLPRDQESEIIDIEEQNNMDAVNTLQEDSVLKVNEPFKDDKSHEFVGNLQQKDSNVAEDLTEDIMDIDFSDDF